MLDEYGEMWRDDPERMERLCALLMRGRGRTIMLSSNPASGWIVENGRVVHSFGPQDDYPRLEADDA